MSKDWFVMMLIVILAGCSNSFKNKETKYYSVYCHHKLQENYVIDISSTENSFSGQVLGDFFKTTWPSSICNYQYEYAIINMTM